MYRKLQIQSIIPNLRQVEKLIDEITNELGISKDCYGKILVSTLEGVNNAITHGNKSDPQKVVNILIENFNNELNIIIQDEGEGFNPEEVPDPTRPENIEEINGRGVFLMSKLADKISFNDKGNVVTMTFKIILV